MIEGYVGLIGHGKTMLAADHAIATATRRGALLASNIRLVPPKGSGVEFVPLLVGDDGLDLEQLRTLVDRCRRDGRGLVILVDEVGIIMPARFWQSFPIGLMFVLSQSRKLSLDLIWTSQDVEQVDSFLRRLTQWVYKVRAIPSPSLERRERGKRPWVMVRDRFRPAHVTGAAQDKRTERAWIRYRREREAVYDTDELVMPPLHLGRRSGSRPSRSAAPAAGQWNMSDEGPAVHPQGRSAAEDPGAAGVDGRPVGASPAA